MGSRGMYFASFTEIMRDVVVPDHFKNFKDILLIVEYNIENEE